MMSVLGQHVSAAPMAPRFKNPEISSTLESLILSLLEKKSEQPAGFGPTWWHLRSSRKPSARGGSSGSTPDSGDRACGARSHPPPSSTLTVGEPNGQAGLNGTGHAIGDGARRVHRAGPR